MSGRELSRARSPSLEVIRRSGETAPGGRSALPGFPLEAAETLCAPSDPTAPTNPTARTNPVGTSSARTSSSTAPSSTPSSTSPPDGPVIEIGAGDGALTLPLQRLGRPLTGIEIDGRRAARLARRTGPATEIVHADFLGFKVPATPHVLVGNLPFHQTTAMLRRILRAPGWTEAVLLVQWEVARRRAGVSGATMMTAQWWPWFEFRLVSRVPASAFRPRPGVDGGLMTVSRRSQPLVPHRDQQRYQGFVRRVFTGRGNGLARILATDVPELPRREVQHWLRRHRITPATLPRSLGAREWAELFALGSPHSARTGRG